jgi:hypothetical protein
MNMTIIFMNTINYECLGPDQTKTVKIFIRNLLFHQLYLGLRPITSRNFTTIMSGCRRDPEEIDSTKCNDDELQTRSRTEAGQVELEP